ncbi:MAG: biotin--[acetyl-CoA-carboxylase] ligase [Planctomycetota bacterium]
MNAATEFPADLRHAVTQLKNEGIVVSATLLPEVASTNSWAMERLKLSAAEGANRATDIPLGLDQLPHLVIAGKQTAGRGRQGRSWLSSDDSLTFSLVLPNASLLLPIAVGVAITSALESSVEQPIGIKWPNDIVIQSATDGVWRKAAGVLIETVQTQARETTSDGGVVLGVGVNLNRCPRDLPNGGLAATSLSAASKRLEPLDRAEILVQLVTCILDLASGLPWQTHSVLEAFRKRCVLTGHAVRVQRVPGSGADELTGCCQGIDSEGNLTVSTPEGDHTIASGEVLRTRWSVG